MDVPSYSFFFFFFFLSVIGSNMNDVSHSDTASMDHVYIYHSVIAHNILLGFCLVAPKDE